MGVRLARLTGAVRLPRSVTKPPRVVPLLPLGIVAMVVGDRVLAVLASAVVLAQLPADGALRREADQELGGTGGILLAVALDVAVLAAACLLLRWLVRRWVAAQPPEPPRAP